MTNQSFIPGTDAVDIDDSFVMPTCWWKLIDDTEQWDEKVEELRPFVHSWARVMETPLTLIPECWDRHPPLVALLGWLRDVALSVEDPAAMAIQSRDIADMWIRIKAELVVQVRATGGCSAGSHTERPQPAWWAKTSALSEKQGLSLR